MKKIAVFSGNRAESGLLEPLVKELREEFATAFIKVESFDFLRAYNKAHTYLSKFKPDLVICPCDRREAVGVALAALHNGIRIAHIYAGELEASSQDDINRYIISLSSNIHFCNGEKAKRRVENLLRASNIEPEHVYDVGSLAFDGITFDDSILPKGEYDLVLYHPPEPSKVHLINSEIEGLIKSLDKKTVIIGPNGDYGSSIIISYWRDLSADDRVTFYEKGVPRPQFLALLKNCERYISNSSSIALEAPYFNVKVINPSIRNKDREPIVIKIGGSKRICEILANLT